MFAFRATSSVNWLDFLVLSTLTCHFHWRFNCFRSLHVHWQPIIFQLFTLQLIDKLLSALAFQLTFQLLSILTCWHFNYLQWTLFGVISLSAFSSYYSAVFSVKKQATELPTGLTEISHAFINYTSTAFSCFQLLFQLNVTDVWC